MSYRWVTDQVQPNEPEITNHKPVTDNSVIFNTVNALLSSAGFNKDEYVRQGKKSDSDSA